MEQLARELAEEKAAFKISTGLWIMDVSLSFTDDRKSTLSQPCPCTSRVAVEVVE
jgi:hypothetical protein